MIWNRLLFGPITKGNHVEHTITTSMLQLMHFCWCFTSQCFCPLRTNWRSQGARKGWRGAELVGTEEPEGVRRPTEEGGLKVWRREKKEDACQGAAAVAAAAAALKEPGVAAATEVISGPMGSNSTQRQRGRPSAGE